MTKKMLLGMATLLVLLETAQAQYPDRRYSGSVYLLTTREGANLPASAPEDGFPLLVRLQFESHKPLLTLVGCVVQPGNACSVSPAQAIVLEGKAATFCAEAGGTQKVYCILKCDDQETLVAVDRLQFTFAAGRVTEGKSATLQFKAVYANEVRTQDIPITIQESMPEPMLMLKAPATWDGRETIEVAPQIGNLDAMQAMGAGELSYTWNVSDLAVIKEIGPGKLILKRAQNSGQTTVTVAVHNGGRPTTMSSTIRLHWNSTRTWHGQIPW